MLENMQGLLIDQRLSPEEIEIRKEMLSEQLVMGGDMTLRGINIADTVIRAEQFGFQTWGTFYALGNTVTATLPWLTAGIVLTAKTGIDYRKMKRGELTQEQFNKNAKENGVRGVGAVIGGTGGMAAGFAIGSVFFPGIGSLVGAIVGGLGGSYAGEEYAYKAQEAIEQALAKNREDIAARGSTAGIRGSRVRRHSRNSRDSIRHTINSKESRRSSKSPFSPCAAEE